MSEYWLQRAAYNMQKRDKIETSVLNALRQHFGSISNAFKGELIEFQKEFGGFDGTALDPSAPVDTATMAKLRKGYASRIPKAATEQEVLELSKLASLTKRTQAQAVADSLQYQLSKGTLSSIKSIEHGLTDIFRTQYKSMLTDISKHVKIGVQFDQISSSQTRAILSAGYNGTSFSSKLWYDRNRVAEIISDKLPGIMAEGISVEDAAKELSELLNTNRANAARIVRTESTYVMGQADLLLYDDIGIDGYEFLATLDNRTSEICADLDGKTFKAKDAKPGVNFPPMHPNCRSTTVPDVDVSDLEVERWQSKDYVPKVAEDLALKHPSNTPEPKIAKPETDWTGIKARGNPIEAFHRSGEEFTANLTGIQATVVTDYTLAGYEKINEGLRYHLLGGDPLTEGIERAIRVLDSALEGAQTPEDAILYRGLDVDPFVDFKAGDAMQTEAFWSTSLNSSVADDFAPARRGLGIEIRYPKGSRGQYLNGASALKDEEAEVLLPRGIKFRVVSKTASKMVLELI